MKKNKHILLWSSTGTLLVLLWAAFSENVLADWRRAQAHVADHQPPGADFQVQLRQIVVPALHTADRCVSCHVGMAPGETGIAGDRIYGKHPPVVHDPAEMGCTVCHAGQGRATTTADAHGDVEFWPEPMIPVRYAAAGCGTCHSHLEVPDLATLDHGRQLMARYDCLSCHRVDGKGGTLRPGGAGGGEGPDLSRIGAHGFRTDWYEQHIKIRDNVISGKTASPLPWKASFGEVPPDDHDAIDYFLHSRIGNQQLVDAKATFNSLGCRGCHKVNGVGGDDGPDLSRAGQRDPGRTNFSMLKGEHSIPNWYVEHFRSPSTVVPGSQMPAFGLDDTKIDSLVLYLMSLRRTNAPEALWPRDRMRALRLGEREFATDGSTLYGVFCEACHGGSGEGIRYAGQTAFPAIGNLDFLAVASDDFLTATVTHGRPGRRMPAWGEKEGGLRTEEIQTVVKYLRTMGGVPQADPDPKPARWARADAGDGRKLFAENCASCHGPEGLGGEGLALHNRVLLANATDTYFFETIRRGRKGTTMPSFGTGSPVRHALSPQEIEAIVAFLRTWEESK